MGPNSLAISEYVLGRLDAAGIQSNAAAWGLDLLLFYTASTAFEQATRDQKGTAIHTIYESYQSLDALRYPMLAGLTEQLFAGESTGQERFRWGLEVILQGILHKQQS